MKRIILLYLVFNCFYSCGQEKKSESTKSDSRNSLYINLSEYDINKQKIDSTANMDFKNAIIVGNLNFFPNKNDYYNFYKSIYNGKVKQVTLYKKSKSDSYRRFDRMDRFNEKGYLIESEYTYAGNHYYTYDINNNLIKEIQIINGDTINIKDIYYNNIDKIVKIKERHPQEKGDYEYSLDVYIEYDSDGKPIKITNNNPKNKYTKEISYKNNQVTISHKSAEDSRKEIFTYSVNFNLIKEENQNHISINKYDEFNRLSSSMTYRDGEYCCTDFYNHNEEGHLMSRIFTNHLKDHKEITKYKYEFDNFENIIHEYRSNNVTGREYETYYEIEYFE